jgi:hypothetical protein
MRGYRVVLGTSSSDIGIALDELCKRVETLFNSGWVLSGNHIVRFDKESGEWVATQAVTHKKFTLTEWIAAYPDMENKEY